MINLQKLMPDFITPFCEFILTQTDSAYLQHQCSRMSTGLLDYLPISQTVQAGELPENVNYALKSSLLLSFLESVSDVANESKAPNMKHEKFEGVVTSAQGAVVVLVY